jgi:ABC-2 type transport system ATP-binding protein
MIEISNLTKKFDRIVAVDDLTLQVNRGDILGFLGPNGAGKTTTVKMLTGMLTPTSGSATVAGFDIRNSAIEVKKRIGYVPESGAVFESMTAWEYLEMVSELHHLDRDIASRRIREFLSLFGIYEDKDQQLNHYSKGMKQKVLIAAALLHNPDVLFLDEPLNGLDANAARVIKEVLRKFSEQGKTIMFCSHILEVVERICTRIAIIDNGKIVADGSPQDLMLATSRSTLEQAFANLTNSQDAGVFSDEFLQALERP